MTTAQQEQTLTPLKYLQIYVADIDWTPMHNELDRMDLPIEEKKKRRAFTILLPTYDRYAFKNQSFDTFFRYCHKWNQYNARDWVAELKKINEKDKEIAQIRQRCLDLGVIYPLQYNPTTRQAFNWLYEHAEASGDVTDKNRADIKKKFENLVMSYGGQVVCNVFNKPELSRKIQEFPNWRTGYFFERLIHETYKEEELIKIKQLELGKVRNANSNLVKSIRKGTE